MAKVKKDDVAIWKERLSNCMADRKNNVEHDWQVSREQYEDTLVNEKGTKVKNTKIRVNLAFPTIKVLLRGACSNDPFIYITGINPQDEDSGYILQYLENRLWRMQKRKKTIRQIVLDALLLKVGYGLTHIKKDVMTQKPEICLTHVSPYQIWLEGGASSVSNAYFIFREVLMPRMEAEDKWPNVTFDSYEKNNRMSLANPPQSHKNSKNTDRVAIYEVHDQLRHEIAYIVPSSNKFLIQPKTNPYPFESMFTELIFNEIIDEHYGLGDLEPVAMQQEELDRVRTAMLTHTKRGNRKYALQEEEYKEDRLAQLESGEDGAIVKMQDIDNIKVLDDANMSSDIYNYGQLIRGDHREITGINEYMNAGQVKGTKTAYETSQIMQGANTRMSEKPDLVGDFCEEVANKDINIMKKMYPVPQIAKFLGQDKAEVWRYIQQWELQGEHYVRVQAGSTQPIDETSNFQRGLLLFQTFKDDPNVDHAALLNEVMTLMNIRNKSILLGLQKQGGGIMQPGQGPQAIPYGMNPNSREMPQFNAMKSSMPGAGVLK